MTPGIDDGDILDFQTFDINKWDTCRTVYYKISVVQKRKLVELIPKIMKNEFKRIPQTGEPTFYPKRTPEDGLIDGIKLQKNYLILLELLQNHILVLLVT